MALRGRLVLRVAFVMIIVAHGIVDSENEVIRCASVKLHFRQFVSFRLPTAAFPMLDADRLLGLDILVYVDT